MERDGVVEQVAGYPTRVVRMGAGVRRALFIHCSLAHSGAWLGVQSALLDKLSMTAFDRPGHGLSAPWRGGPEDSAELHRTTTEIAGRLIDKRADVIGHSFGATVALRLAMEQPEKVRSLTLIEPPMFAALKGTPAYEASVAMTRAVSECLERDDRMGAARAFNDAVTPDSPFDAMSEKRQARLAEQIHIVAQEGGVTMEDTPNLLGQGRLERIKQPVLLIESMTPPLGMRQIHEVLAARIPQAKRAMIVGAGHMAPITHPENVAGEIAAFLRV